LESECTSSCSSSACADAFQIIRAYHDGCDEDSISQEIEEALHDFEDICSANDCNVERTTDPLICYDDDDNNDDDSASAAATLSALSISFLVVAALA